MGEEVVKWQRKLELEDVERLLIRIEQRGYFKRHEAEFLELFFIPIMPSDADEEYLEKWNALYEKVKHLARTLPIITN
jgi:hypothetical protein